MRTRQPITLVRLGIFRFSLEEAVKRSTIPLTRTGILLGNTVKYVTFQDCPQNYVLMVSQQIERIVSPFGYNAMLTVTSYCPRLNSQVADRFEKETGVYLNLVVPEEYRRLMQTGMGISFKFIERNPKMAMAVLRGDLVGREPSDYSAN